MKAWKRICLIITFVLIFYSVVSMCFRAYVRNNTTLEFCNETYTEFDCLQGNFIPFGADNSWYETDIGYYNLLGLSFLKTDRNINFIYYKDFLGSTVYIKDSYTVPEFPTTDMVDELLLYYEAKDKCIAIKDKDHIDCIMNFLSTHDISADKPNESSIVFYAVSNNIGGVFQLNESGSIYFKKNKKIGFGHIITGEIPDNMQDIIDLYNR